ncbi:hypothetical protein [Pseudogemmobacter sonorensis]|uniref:hypothetical protein n=1 Tax=Pseudogemmobacter sonorensis TaxID=2989681 RepID=UPI0036831B46
MSGIRIKDTPEVRAVFAQLWCARPLITREKIGSVLGVSNRAVSIYASRLGLPRRKSGAAGTPGTLLSGQGAEELFRRLWIDGVANAEILRALGRSNHPANVSQAARVRGLPKRPRNFRGMTLAEWSLREGMKASASETKAAMRAAGMCVR